VLGIYARSSPAAPAPQSFSPFLFSSAPLTLASFTSGPTILKSCGPQQLVTTANEKNGSARPPARVRFVPRNTLSLQIASVLIRLPLDPTFLAGGLALTVTSMARLVFPVTGCPLVR
jgi:hypothetical protein